MEKLNRRKFIRGAAAAATAFGFQVVPSRVFGANDRLVLAGIGTGGKGASDIEGSFGAGFEIGVLCDVVNAEKYPNLDGRAKAIGGTRKKFPNARFYEDWREMLEAEKGKVDAVTVSTPDHVHAFASIAAMRAGMSVYCQKPLTHGIWEARAMTKVASQTGVVTQMGNQAHAGQHMRRMVELVRSGIIGDVTEVHCWTNRPIWPQGMAAFPAGEEAPKHINWDLWLGPAPQHDYNEKIMPFNWRGYWDFGTGALGDMACHVMDMAYWSLELGSPTSVSAEHGGATEVSPPVWATITYEFPARDKRPPVKFVWYDGNMDAVFDEKTWKLVSKDNPNSPPKEPNQPPKDITEGQPIDEGKGYGTIMIGSRGKLWYQRDKDNWMVKPSSILDGAKYVEPFIPRARGHNPHNEFYDAVKAGDPKMALSGIHQSGPFTEMVLLGNLAIRVGKKIEWDAANLKCPNAPEADQFIKRQYRSGWDLKVDL